MLQWEYGNKIIGYDTKGNLMDESGNTVTEKQLISDGCGVKYIPNHGRLGSWRALHS